MGKFMKEANNKYKDAMDNFNIDEFQDNLEDMQDMAREHNEINEMMND